MKKVSTALIVLTLTFCAALASAQQQDQPGVNPGEQAVVRIAHLSPDAPAITVAINGENVFGGVAYRDVSAYQTVPSGSVEVSISAEGEAEPIISATLDVEEGIYYTIAALGSGDDLEARVYRDNLRAFPPANGASIRVLHASQAAGAVDVAVAGGEVLVENLAFGQVSEYFFVPAGNYDIEVRETGTDNVAFNIGGLEVQAGYVYTHFVIGGPEGEVVMEEDAELGTESDTAPDTEPDTETTEEGETQEVQTTTPVTPTDEEAEDAAVDPEADPAEAEEADAQPAEATEEPSEPVETDETPLEEEEEEAPSGQTPSWLVQDSGPVFMHIAQQTELQAVPQTAEQEAGLGALIINVQFVDTDRLQLDVFGPGDFHETYLAEEQQTLANLEPGTYLVTVNVPGWTDEQEAETRSGDEVEVVAGETVEVTVAPQAQDGQAAQQAQATTQQQQTQQQTQQQAQQQQTEQAAEGEGSLTITVDHMGADEVELLVSGEGYNENIAVPADQAEQTLEGLQPGTYVVTVIEPRFEGQEVELQTEVEVSAGETAAVTVPVRQDAATQATTEATTEATTQETATDETPTETADAETADTETETVDTEATEVAAGQGSLEILIEQAGVTVEVSGPGGYTRSVSQSQTLIDLEPGTYQLAASGDGYDARSQDVEVTGEETVTVVIDETTPVGEPTAETEVAEPAVDEVEEEDVTAVEEAEDTEEVETVEEVEEVDEVETVDEAEEVDEVETVEEVEEVDEVETVDEAEEAEPAATDAPAPGGFEVIVTVDARIDGAPEDDNQNDQRN